MKPLFIQYPKCTTCKKALKWLTDNNIDFDNRDIVLQNPTEKELTTWVKKSQKPVSKFFNTSGLRYKALNLKDVVKTAPEAQLIKTLSTEGMLVKRPILVTDNGVLTGFNEEVWRAELIK